MAVGVCQKEGFPGKSGRVGHKKRRNDYRTVEEDEVKLREGRRGGEAEDLEKKERERESRRGEKERKGDGRSRRLRF